MSVDEPRDLKEIAASAELSEQAAGFVENETSPHGCVVALAGANQFIDAIQLLSQWLPPREALWWGCQCFWHVYRPSPAAADDAVLRAVVAWIFEPDEERRRLADQVGIASGRNSPASYLAKAVFYSEGSLSAPGLPEVLPPPSLYGKTLYAALMLLSSKVPGPEADRFFRQCVQLGLDVAEGRNRWDGASMPVTRSAERPVQPALSDRIDEGSVSKHWNEAEEPELVLPTTVPPQPVAPLPPPAPRKKAIKKSAGSEIWEDLSQTED